MWGLAPLSTISPKTKDVSFKMAQTQKCQESAHFRSLNRVIFTWQIVSANQLLLLSRFEVSDSFFLLEKMKFAFQKGQKKTKHISNKMLMRFYFRHLVYGLHSLRLYIILRKHLQNDCRNKKHTVFHFEARERFLFQHEDKIICVSQHISKSGIVSFTMIKLTVHQTTNLCSTWWIY